MGFAASVAWRAYQGHKKTPALPPRSKLECLPCRLIFSLHTNHQVLDCLHVHIRHYNNPTDAKP